MIKIDIYNDHCLIWFDNLSDDIISTIIKLIKGESLKYDLHNKSATVYNPPYSLLYEISVYSYILLQ